MSSARLHSSESTAESATDLRREGAAPSADNRLPSTPFVSNYKAARRSLNPIQMNQLGNAMRPRPQAIAISSGISNTLPATTNQAKMPVPIPT